MIATFRDFNKIKFPIYVIPSDNWYYVDRVLFIDNQVLDDKSVPGKTMGIRRLLCGRKDLFILRKIVFSAQELLSCKYKYFIDRNGKPFIYIKTYFSSISNYRIKKIEKKKQASLIWAYGIDFPFTVIRPPINKYEFISVLHYDKSPWMIYEYSNSEKPNRKRKKI